MEVKGTAVSTIPVFVKEKFPARYKEWVNSLSTTSKAIMDGTVLAVGWYSMNDALIEPTQKICDLFYNGNDKGAWEAGRFSASHSLRGIYRLFVKVGTPQFIIKKASQIFSSYYRPSTIEVPVVESKQVVVQITKFPDAHPMIEGRIGGWIEQALELSGCTGVKSKIIRSMTRGDKVTEYSFSWN